MLSPDTDFSDVFLFLNLPPPISQDSVEKLLAALRKRYRNLKVDITTDAPEGGYVLHVHDRGSGLNEVLYNDLGRPIDGIPLLSILIYEAAESDTEKYRLPPG